VKRREKVTQRAAQRSSQSSMYEEGELRGRVEGLTKGGIWEAGGCLVKKKGKKGQKIETTAVNR